MIDHYFTVHGCQEKDVKLHADNCVGQNKNNALIHYLLWRTMTGRHRSAELSFMLVGHTKFSPDRFFGLIKKTYRLSTISTINELQRVVRRSSVEQTIPQLIRDIFGVLQVTFHQWTMFLSNFYTPIPNISKYHCFPASADNPGIVFVREFSDSPEMQLTILKKGLSLEALYTTMPEKTTIPGLDIN